MISHPRETPFLIGHQDQVGLCLDRLGQGRFPHALLLQGPKGVGKATFAYHLIRTLFSEPSQDAEKKSPFVSEDSFRCDPESALFKRVRARGHGDLKIVERVPDAKGKWPRDITIAQIRSVTSFFSMSPLEGGWRIALIDSVDEMNVQAGNALLKILEEPPEKSLLILINHTPGKLLATLSSRCQKISFRPLEGEGARQVVAAQKPNIGADQLQKVTTLFPGSPGRMLAFFEGKTEELLGALHDLTKHLPLQRPFDPFPFLDKVFPQRGTEASENFPLVTFALLEWLYAFIQEGANRTLSAPRQALFQQKSGLEWTALYTELTSLFQGVDRLSYAPRHVILCALMKIVSPRKGQNV